MPFVKEMSTISVMEFAGEPGVVVEGRILKNALILGCKSLNRNRVYPQAVRESACPQFVGRSVFVDHTVEEHGQKYYRRPYTELLGTVQHAWSAPDGIRADICLAHHPVSESVIKNINDKLPIGGFSPELDVIFGANGEDGSEIVAEIVRVKCVALTSCPATTSLVESVVDEKTTEDDLAQDGEYHKRRALMAEIEAILLAAEDEEDNSREQKFLRIHQILGAHLGVEDCPGDCKESVQETKEEVQVEETVIPELEVKSPTPKEFVPEANLRRRSREEIFNACWK